MGTELLSAREIVRRCVRFPDAPVGRTDGPIAVTVERRSEP
jgi:hypothetical protein